MATDRRDRRDRDPAGETPRADTEHAAHLERSRRVWDRWSDWYGLSERDFEPMREAAIERLDLEPGDRVLEIGPGPGVNFELIRNEVGPGGELVAVDYSPEMVAKARDRVERYGWENVTVRRADATTAAFDEPFDAAVATLSLSVMPDVRRATETVFDALEPGRRFVVFDLCPVPSGPARIANPFLRWFLRWYANWNSDDDVLESLEAVFDSCRVVETYGAGTAYTAVCEKGRDR